MGLFDKKFCDICGEKIGLLGNRKLDDGNMCKDCAKLLSPFFSDRRSSSVADIKKQLEYREQNKQVLAQFRPSLVLGDSNQKVYIDAAKQQFVVSRYSQNNWDEENPDVMSFSQISSITLDVDEDRDEQYTTDRDGNRMSYSPPQYKYYYDFKLKFIVNHPWFDDFNVRLNTSRVEGIGHEYNKFNQMAMQIQNALMPGSQPAMGMGAAPMGMNMGMNQGFQPQQNMGYGQQPMGMNQGFQPQQNMGYGQQPMGMNQGFQPQQNMGYGQQPMGMNQGFQPQQNMGYGQQPMGMNQGFQPQQNMGYGQMGSAIRCDKCGWMHDGQSAAPKFCPACGDPITMNDMV